MTTNKDTVLVVDDEPTDVEMLRKALEEAGFNVLTAGDGYSAIRVFREFGDEVKLLVVDVAMSPMNGCDLALQLAAFQPQLRVLFVSGYTGAEILRREGMAGLSANFLRKPFTKDQLRERVQALVETSKP
jgi:DNA-binding response OmpR family regulator